MEHQTPSFIQERSHPVPSLHRHVPSHLLWIQVPGVLREPYTKHRTQWEVSTDLKWKRNMTCKKLFLFLSVVSQFAFLLKKGFVAILYQDLTLSGVWQYEPASHVIVLISCLMPGFNLDILWCKALVERCLCSPKQSGLNANSTLHCSAVYTINYTEFSIVYYSCHTELLCGPWHLNFIRNIFQ